ncbi:carbohydrate kinase [Parabacteroides sp. OttesenSCG-928-K15]|nr:carbohydrate kinase [Parabacteroides sp. OttesenSCG-928-K15]
MRKVIGIGETILDIIFKDNQPHRAIPGGTVFNGFISLSRMGVPLTFISELGNDKIGEIIRNFMTENGLSTEFIDCYPDGKSPLALAFLDEELNASYMVYKDYPAQRLDVGYPRIDADDIFILGSYYALNPAVREKVFEFLQYARERNAIIYYDPNFRKPHVHEAIRLRPTLIENLEFADIVRGSEEDFFYLYGETDMEKVYEQHIRFYCDKLICTHGAKGVTIFSDDNRGHFSVPAIDPVSTVGAGDNFNAGFIYGLLKYKITRTDLATLDRENWGKLMRCAIDFATEACKSYDNYISKEFAASYS